jgi:hypothetical protein
LIDQLFNSSEKRLARLLLNFSQISARKAGRSRSWESTFAFAISSKVSDFVQTAAADGRRLAGRGRLVSQERFNVKSRAVPARCRAILVEYRSSKSGRSRAQADADEFRQHADETTR